MIRNATIDLARKYPFGRTLVNTGRMSMASKYTHSALSEIPLADRFLVDAPVQVGRCRTSPCRGTAIW
jgi:hypothetical protein